MKQDKLVELRGNFRLLLLQNPDYFGNLTQAGIPIKGFEPAVNMVSNTDYEELTCISFNPDTNKIGAVIQIKQSTGYSGGPCTNGSKEYVRFYVDYNRDGSWVDEGIANFDAHDLPFGKNLCYAVSLQIDPDKQSCCNDTPVLPRVRAILSWNDEPPTGNPNWLPVWGNRLEANVQIAPYVWCLILQGKLDELGIHLDPTQIKDVASAFAIEEMPVSPPQATLPALRAQYGDQVEEARLGYKIVQAATKDPTQWALLERAEMLQVYGFNIAQVVEFLQTSKFNTTYEEVKCVGLDRDLSNLHAGILVKRPSGYSGDLCHEGSREYVAFYMDFGSGWEYMGTTSVRVHDIPSIPGDGLWYGADLPVSLTQHQKTWCQTGKAKVKAILSWDVLPSPNDPNYVAPWGDWEECDVEIRPLPKKVSPGKVVPVIESVGGMPVSLINNSGYANGENPAGLKAIDSPFDGKILINGIITNAPDSSAPLVSRLRYRIVVKQPSDSQPQPLLRKFAIWVTTISGGIPSLPVPIVQIPDSNGGLDYYPDFIVPDIVSVDQNLLGVFVPAEDGLHWLRVEILHPVTGTPIQQSNVVKFMVDKKRPQVDVEITSGTGNCGVFTQGDVLSGTFFIKDNHCYSVALSVTPQAETHGARPTINGSGGLSVLKYGSGGLPGAGVNGGWTLNTKPMDPCGYNIRIHGEDRTIVDSRTFGYESWDIEGFCLMALGKK
jgi:hypothetical protein